MSDRIWALSHPTSKRRVLGEGLTILLKPKLLKRQSNNSLGLIKAKEKSNEIGFVTWNLSHFEMWAPQTWGRYKYIDQLKQWMINEETAAKDRTKIEEVQSEQEKSIGNKND